MNGWFPKMNGVGDVVSGNTDIYVTRYGKDPWYLGKGRGPGWISPTEVIYFDDSRNQTIIKNIFGDEVVSIDGVYNSLESSEDGRWSGFLQGGLGRVYNYFRNNLAETIDEACNPKVALGTFAFLIPYQGSPRRLVVNGTLYAEGVITNFALGKEIVWRESTGIYFGVLKAKTGIVSVRDDEDIIQVIDAVGIPYLLTNSQAGILLHRPGDPFGYNIPGQMFYPCAMWIENKFHIVGSYANGEPRVYDIPFLSSKIDLRFNTPPIIVQPPIPKPIPKVSMVPQSELTRLASAIDSKKNLLVLHQPSLPFCIAVAKALGGNWGLNGKRGNASDPSRDCVDYLDGNTVHLYDIVLGAFDPSIPLDPSERNVPNIPSINDQGEVHTNGDGAIWLDPNSFTSTVPNPTPIPVPDNNNLRLLKLEGELEVLRSLMIKNGDSIAIQSSRGRFLRDDWGNDTGKFDRDEAGSGEVYKIVKK